MGLDPLGLNCLFRNSEVNYPILVFFNKLIIFSSIIQRVSIYSALGVYTYNAGFIVRNFKFFVTYSALNLARNSTRNLGIYGLV